MLAIYPSRSLVSSLTTVRPHRLPAPPTRPRTPPRRAHDDGVARVRLRVRRLLAGPRRGVDRGDPVLPLRLVGATPALALEPGQPRPAVLVRPRGTY